MYDYETIAKFGKNPRQFYYCGEFFDIHYIRIAGTNIIVTFCNDAGLNIDVVSIKARLFR